MKTLFSDLPGMKESCLFLLISSLMEQRKKEKTKKWTRPISYLLFGIYT